ncbi:MAG: fructose-bisphosphatase class III, partial [Candidatus Promineifilaceae bacterium]|nr:fructose-bisphosphatase class III [Candidatus Promineifilaceae bacterium]
MIDEAKQAYLELLSAKYPSIQAASTRIVNLTAELNLPKGTEHFISDIHGEFEAFRHVLRSGSGSVKRKIEDTFPDLPAEEKRMLATLIYYPEEKLPLVLETVKDQASWYRTTLVRLLEVGRLASAKYSRTRVRQFLPQPFTDIIDELLHRQGDVEAKAAYYNSMIETIIGTGSAKGVIVALAELIQKLVIARLHVIGDVYDRGPGAHLIMDALVDYHNVDVQWGNHDILWMAAAAGSDACIANVIRISLRYANMETLDNGYAISLLPLATFALNTYRDDPCDQFEPRVSDETEFTEQELRLMAQMHKAITVIQLKLEGQIIQRR